MKVVMFWQVGDTVVSVLEPAKTWIVTEVCLKAKDRWVKLENTKDCFSVPGCGSMEGSETLIQQMGFVGYRKNSTILIKN